MADAAFLRTAELLRLPVTEIAYCPHQAHPVACWCRKPLPGLGVYLMERHRLARKHLIVVGDMAGNTKFAAALGCEILGCGAVLRMERNSIQKTFDRQIPAR